ncbi:cytochrome o ubiquinol oxidase subunit IV [Candidatus Kaiserbacteria bacterium]|nr:cytochrome o ubiquinol oxidase subunit IV [Candidatus Kaiserbacteria bacterium]
MEHSTLHQAHGTFASYTLGFVISIALTLAAFALVAGHILAGGTLVFALVGLAVAQLFVQLLFFLRLGKGTKPYWDLSVLYFALLIVIILAAGSLWIMQNLNYNMMQMSSEEKDAYMIDQ